MWCVVTSYSFDMEFHVYGCKTRDEAVSLMRKIFWNTVRTEERESAVALNENGTFIDEESGYAKILWGNDDGMADKDNMEIRVAEVENK